MLIVLSGGLMLFLSKKIRLFTEPKWSIDIFEGLVFGVTNGFAGIQVSLSHKL